MHDTVYAFDADSATAPVLWQTSLLTYSPAGATPVPVSVKGCGGTNAFTEVGVVSTPVIDRTTGSLYLVAETYENLKVAHRLHVLDVTTGLERAGSPVTITASYTSNGATYRFVDTRQMNRPGLLLANGHLYIAFGSPGCNGGDQGWVMSYLTSTLQQDGVFDDEPGGWFAAIWQKGAGISIGPGGAVFVATGEGTFTAGTNLAISVLKLTQSPGKLTLADWFSPYNWQFLSDNDWD